MNAESLNLLQSIKYGRFIEVTMNNGKQFNGEFRGITQLLDSDGNHQSTADILNIAAYITDPNMPAAKKEQMFGFRVTRVKTIKTYKSVDEQQKDIQMERALIRTNKALAKIDFSQVFATTTTTTNN